MMRFDRPRSDSALSTAVVAKDGEIAVLRHAPLSARSSAGALTAPCTTAELLNIPGAARADRKAARTWRRPVRHALCGAYPANRRMEAQFSQ